MKLLLKAFVGLLALWTGGLLQAAPLIVDHTKVDLYTNLTAGDIARVKTMWLNVLGASHASGYRAGPQILQNNVDSRLAVSVVDSGNPEAYTTNHLRVSGAIRNQYFSWNFFVGEESWYASEASLERVKNHLSYCSTNNLQITAIGLGWSWQPTWHNLPGGGIDPVYQVRWAGGTEGGPDGDLRWGLTDESYALTQNHVSMDTYLRATQHYIDYCKSNGFATKVFYTTGPPDGDGGRGESGYQRHLKYEHIRNHVKSSSDAILFDYADIMSWSDNGEHATNSWTDFGGTPRLYAGLHPDNLLNLDGSYGGGSSFHIGQRGAIRLAKAIWYMLARMTEQTPSPTPPVLLANSMTAGGVQMQFTAASNTVYSVQFTDDLQSASWNNLTNFSSQPFERSIRFINQSSSTNANGFYRVTAQAAP